MKAKLLTLSILIFFTFHTQAQSNLFIDISITPEQMVEDFFDGICVDISNVNYTGDMLSRGYFEGANTNIGVPAGIILSSGFATTAATANNGTGTSGNTTGGDDPDLNAIANGNINDASVLEFDFVSEMDDTLYFSYVFASEEYPEYACTGFNDMFGFFVTGPKPSGGNYEGENIALIPDTLDPSGYTYTDLPVTINTVNPGVPGSAGGTVANCSPPNGSLAFPMYYINNSSSTDITYDGFTIEFFAPLAVLANESYHIKLAVSDVGDSVFDSSIFLGVESLCGDSLVVPPADAQISIDGNTISLTNESRYATEYLWDFGDNFTSTERYPEPHTYAQDGYYNISLITQNYCCSDTFLMTIPIGNVLPVDVNSCDVGYFGLNGIEPAVGEEGLWTVIIGNGTLSNASDPNSDLFDPSVGINILEWKITETSSGNQVYIDTFVLNISALPDVSISTELASLCENDAPVQLDGLPIGGEFVGAGVNGNIFDPSNAGIGNHTISYSYTDENGCFDSETIEIEIIPVPATPEIILIGNDSLFCNVSGDSYIWELNGNAIAANSQQILLEGDGNYTVTVIQSGCSSEPSEEFLFSGILDVLENAEHTLKVLPNPAIDFIKVQLSDLKLTGTLESVKIINVQGQVMLQFSDLPASNDLDLDVSELSNGIYFMQIIQKGNNFSGSFIKR